MIFRKFSWCLIIALSVFALNANAQSIFIMDDSSIGFAANAGIGFGEGFSGPVIGGSYSIKGKVDLGASYSSLTGNGISTTGYSIGASFFATRQNMDDYSFNVDISPTFSSLTIRDHVETTATVGLGISKDLSDDPKFHFIPEARASYGVLVQRSEYLALLGFGLNMGFNVGDNILLILNPGVAANLLQKGTTGSVTAGIMLH